MNVAFSRYLIVITLVTTTGCTSTSINDSIALIHKENSRTVDEQVLKNIQELRYNQQTKNPTYTFTYPLSNKQLAYDDRITIATLLTRKNKNIIIKMAPASAVDKLKQLSLSMERAKILRQYIARFNQNITIIFAPQLSTDTINLVTGA